MGIYYSEDTLGSQIHLGGTSVFTMTGELTQGWLDSMGKTVDVLNKYDVSHILTGHTPYPIEKDYAAWMGAAIDYIEAQLKENKTFSGLVVIEDGVVINGTDRFAEIFATGLTDKEVFDFASVNFMNFYQSEDDNEDSKPSSKDPTQTGDENNIVLWTTAVIVALGGAIVLIKSKKEEM